MSNSIRKLVMLPSYVAPEDKELLAKAEKILVDYNDSLLASLKKRIDIYPSIQPRPSEIQRAEREFYEDPMRQYLIKNLINVKSLCERPRFLIKETNPSEE